METGLGQPCSKKNPLCGLSAGELAEQIDGGPLSQTVQSLIVLFSFSIGKAASLASSECPSHSLTKVTCQHCHGGRLHFSEAPGWFQTREPTEGLLLRDGLSLLGAGPGNEMRGRDLESPCLEYLQKM